MLNKLINLRAEKMLSKLINLKAGIMLNKNKMLKNNKGMTLLEVIAVVAIIAGIYATMVTVIFPRMEKSKIDQAKILISRIAEAVDTFYLDCSFYPSTADGLSALVLAPELCESWGPDPYLKNGKIPKDPWKNDFIYSLDENTGKYEIISLGQGGKEGGEGYSEDISSQDL